MLLYENYYETQVLSLGFEVQILMASGHFMANGFC